MDEYRQTQTDCSSPDAFELSHAAFATQRCAALARLAAEEPRRRALLIPLQRPPKPPKDWAEAAQAFAPLVRQAAIELHQLHHGVDPSSGKRVSFGLIRMANIEPLVETALALYRQGVPAGLRIHLCVYHSQFPLLIRSAIERQLDDSLQRHHADAVFALPDIRARLDACTEPDQLFVVLASAVAEVGRDHDYDWAVVEPSSMRSLIQLAGRVRRHRPGAVKSANVRVFASNLRHWRQPAQAAFRWPGFEDNDSYRLQSHDLNRLLDEADYTVIDARPRIASRLPAELRPQQHWVDLEHSRMRQTMLALNQAPLASAGNGGRVRKSDHGPAKPVFNASTWWRAPPADALLTAVIPQKQRFRDSRPDLDLVLLPDEDGEQPLLHRVKDRRDWRPGESPYIEVQRSEHKPLDDALVQGERIQTWGVTDYLQALRALADELGLPSLEAARRFGTISVPAPQESAPTGWRSHPALGFVKRR